MSSLNKHQDLVKDSLVAFIEKHLDGELLSCIDDIVLNYMTSVLEDVGVEASHEDPFNIEDFIEMMSAYLPGFTSVESSTVCEWLFCLAKQLSDMKNSASPSDTGAESLIDLPRRQQNGALTSPSHESPKPFIHLYLTSTTPRIPSATKSGDEVHLTNGTEQDTKIHDGCQSGIGKDEDLEDSWNGEQENDESITDSREDKQVALLQELFPSVCVLEVTQCLAIAGGDAEQAAQLIMHRAENCESFSPNSLQSVTKLKIRPQDDKQLKEHILERYAYVDQADDQREHKPVAPKPAPKKLVRYRDSKIVSLKGEKYTEVKKDDDEDAVKKTHVTLKPARQYRFH